MTKKDQQPTNPAPAQADKPAEVASVQQTPHGEAATQTNVQKVPSAKAQFEATLKKYTSHIERLLSGKHNITPDEFMVKCLTAVSKVPQLLQCTKESMFASVFYFAELGLPFNTPEGFGYILPYKNRGIMEATPILGYRGLIEIAYRNPKLKSLRMQAVYENDEFDFQYGSTEYIRHIPAANNRGSLVRVYAMAKIEGVDPLFVVIGMDELAEIQKLSKAATSQHSPYNNGTDIFNTMQSKVAIKQLFKVLPKTGNELLIKAMDTDDKVESKKANSFMRLDEDELPYAAVIDEATEPLQDSESITPIDVVVSDDKKSENQKASESPSTGKQTEIPMK